MDQVLDIVDRQRLELEHPATAHKRAIDREERILRRGADENHDTVFHVRQEHVLLGTVKAVNLVDKQERLLPIGRQPIAGFQEHVAQLFDAACDRAQLHERAATLGRQKPCERGLACAGRAVKNHRPQPVRLQEAIQQFAFAEKMPLPDKLGE